MPSIGSLQRPSVRGFSGRRGWNFKPPVFLQVRAAAHSTARRFSNCIVPSPSPRPEFSLNLAIVCASGAQSASKRHFVPQRHRLFAETCFVGRMRTSDKTEAAEPVWRIYHVDQESARELGDPLRTVFEQRARRTLNGKRNDLALGMPGLIHSRQWRSTTRSGYQSTCVIDRTPTVLRPI
jgi:hypothetical protein